MWETLFVKPVLNVLILVQSYMPGQDLGLAILLFTLLFKVITWPIIKKQIHQNRIMQQVAPEIKEIRKKTKGSRDPEVMKSVNSEISAVYARYGTNPYASLLPTLIQLPVFLAIYSAVKTAFKGNQNLDSLIYGPLKSLSYVKNILAEGGNQVTTFADWADLSLRPFGANKIYTPVLIIALVSIAVQFLQVKQITPAKKTPKKGEEPDPTEKVANATPYIIVILFGWIALSVEGAISFYLASGALITIFQQAYLMNKEKELAVIEQKKKPTIKVLTEKEDKEIKKEKLDTKNSSVKPVLKNKNSSSKSSPSKSKKKNSNSKTGKKKRK
jgi:YidC/Oxa1 family membrane protein insertase